MAGYEEKGCREGCREQYQVGMVKVEKVGAGNTVEELEEGKQVGDLGKEQLP